MTTIEYRDNGCGYELDKIESNSLGLKLVSLLMKQLSASFEDLTTLDGVHYRFSFSEASNHG